MQAAGEPYRTLFTVAALTGARLSELLALTWADVRLDDLDELSSSLAARSTVTAADRQPRRTDRHARCRFPRNWH